VPVWAWVPVWALGSLGVVPVWALGSARAGAGGVNFGGRPRAWREYCHHRSAEVTLRLVDDVSGESAANSAEAELGRGR
jgi:hypothetical protein